MQPEPQKQKKPNRLIKEKSPYLLQHAYNPVDWYPWTQEAFDKAKAENKPIFLSIGYASCHWCHVMEKECFEDQDVADLLNSAFVCIKVDREERPDIDASYMAACQAMGKNCGWPLNILMTPRLNPFFVASYIPKTGVRGLAGMMELVPQVMDIWRTRQKEMDIVGADIKSRIDAMERRFSEEGLRKEVLDETYESLERSFDSENGGFGSAPKFPRPHSLMFLLRYWKRSGNKKALDMVEKTLAQMRQGGIYDQVGFGFHRYSMDASWLVPHFEKMLYDQALMTMTYTEAFQATSSRRYEFAAREIIEYTLRELITPQGTFYSSQDADSEGEEGKFYLWTMEEILDTLSPADADLAVQIFGIKQEGNFPDKSGKDNGENILHFAGSLEDLAPYKGLTLEELITRVHNIRAELFEKRKNRVPPAKDEKVLTDWNGLMIAALARAGKSLNESKYLKSAMKAAGFFLSEMGNQDGKLYHRFADGQKAIEGFLDDYAFLAFGLIELYEATFENRYLKAATELTQKMNALFWDEREGGFFFTATKPDSGMPRMKQVYDGSAPSGNSVALLNLLRLSRIISESSFEEKANQLVKTFSEEAKSAPQAYTWLLAGVDLIVGPSQKVVLVGDPKEEDTFKMTEALKTQYLPNMVVSLVEPANAWAGYEKLEGKASAYVCVNQTCMPPTNQTEKMLELLGAKVS